MYIARKPKRIQKMLLKLPYQKTTTSTLLFIIKLYLDYKNFTFASKCVCVLTSFIGYTSNGWILWNKQQNHCESGKNFEMGRYSNVTISIIIYVDGRHFAIFKVTDLI